MKEYRLKDRKPASAEPAPFTDEETELGREISQGLRPVGEKEVDALAPEDEPKELTEEFLEKYATDKLRLDALEKSLEKRKDAILGLSGREAGVVQIGKAIIKKKPRAGRTTVDWEKWLKMLVKDNMLDEEVVEKLAETKEAVKKNQIEVGYIKKGKDGLDLTVDVVA